MEITETKKAIIEFLHNEEIRTWQVFMDKTLIEWCLVKWDRGIQKIKKIDDTIIGYSIDMMEWFWALCDTLEQFKEQFKILWHYDITAILKYIKYKIPLFVSTDFQWLKNWKVRIQKIEILNKPLHLYTEEEDKILFNLLKELWTN